MAYPSKDDQKGSSATFPDSFRDGFSHLGYFYEPMKSDLDSTGPVSFEIFGNPSTDGSWCSVPVFARRLYGRISSTGRRDAGLPDFILGNSSSASAELEVEHRRKLFILSGFVLGCASMSPVIIDDTFGDPVTGAQITYSPLTGDLHWQKGLDCVVCNSHPDPSQTYLGNWHDCTKPENQTATATVTFSGTSVAVYGVIDNGRKTSSNLIFFIDGKRVGQPFFNQNQDPNAEPQYIYNVQFFSADSLSPEEHTLVIHNGNFTDGSFMLLDSIVYTPISTGQSASSATSSSSATATGVSTSPDMNPQTSKPKSHTGLIIGVAIATLVAVGCAAFTLFYIHRRHKLAQLIPTINPQLSLRHDTESPVVANQKHRPTEGTKTSETGAPPSTLTSDEIRLIRQVITQDLRANTSDSVSMLSRSEPPAYS
ncbi:hypothetical protein C8J56DRAFT_1087397 [Mycena floridula]|nr:hypothetical protein C8J56DRAFT_1087397 [Mycena floridula]